MQHQRRAMHDGVCKLRIWGIHGSLHLPLPSACRYPFHHSGQRGDWPERQRSLSQWLLLSPIEVRDVAFWALSRGACDESVAVLWSSRWPREEERWAGRTSERRRSSDGLKLTPVIIPFLMFLRAARFPCDGVGFEAASEPAPVERSLQ
jgi:hypothetical protein